MPALNSPCGWPRVNASPGKRKGEGEEGRGWRGLCCTSYANGTGTATDGAATGETGEAGAAAAAAATMDADAGVGAAAREPAAPRAGKGAGGLPASGAAAANGTVEAGSLKRVPTVDSRLALLHMHDMPTAGNYDAACRRALAGSK